MCLGFKSATQRQAGFQQRAGLQLRLTLGLLRLKNGWSGLELPPVPPVLPGASVGLISTWWRRHCYALPPRPCPGTSITFLLILLHSGIDTYTHTHKRMRTRTHACTHACTHAHIQEGFQLPPLSSALDFPQVPAGLSLALHVDSLSLQQG